MTEEQKEAIRESAKRSEVRLKHSISGKKHYSDPENRAKASDRMKKVFQEHPEYGKKRSELLKKYYSDPENRLKHKMRLDKLRSNPEYRKKLSEGVKRAWANRTPEEREKIVAKFTESNRREDVRAKNSVSVKKRRIQTLDEILSKTKNPGRRAKGNRIRMKNFYGYRDMFYKMSHQINYDYIDQYISDAEIFIKYFSAIK